MEGMRRNRHSFVRSGIEETDLDPLCRAIRTLLMALPHIDAPLGLESRLWKRIAQIGSRRLGLSWDLWILARRWLSVGLGVATAVVIGLVFFGSQQTEMPSTTFSEGTEQSVQASPGALSEATPVNEGNAQDRSFTGSPERETSFEMVAASDRQDDSLKREFNPPSGHFESVGGNSPVRGK